MMLINKYNMISYFKSKLIKKTENNRLDYNHIFKTNFINFFLSEPWAFLLESTIGDLCCNTIKMLLVEPSDKRVFPRFTIWRSSKPHPLVLIKVCRHSATQTERNFPYQKALPYLKQRNLFDIPASPALFLFRPDVRKRCWNSLTLTVDDQKIFIYTSLNAPWVIKIIHALWAKSVRNLASPRICQKPNPY